MDEMAWHSLCYLLTGCAFSLLSLSTEWVADPHPALELFPVVPTQLRPPGLTRGNLRT